MRLMTKARVSVGIVCCALMIVGVGGSRSYAALGATGGYDGPYFQTDFVQELADWSSSLVNPALLYRVNQWHASLGAYRWAIGKGDPLGYQNASILRPIRRNQTVGLTMLWTKSTITKTDIDESLNIVEGGATSFTDMWLIGNYAVRMPLPWLMLGLNAKIRIERQFSNQLRASTPGFDLGVYVNPVDHYRFGDLGLSLNFQDILPTQTTWESGETQTTQTMATRLRLGLRYAAFNDKLILDGEGVVDNAFVGMVKGLGLLDEEAFIPDSATEDEVQNVRDNLNMLAKVFRVNGHFRYQFVPQVWLKAGWNNTNIPYVGFNVHLIYPLPEMINYVNLDYNVGYSFLENIGGGQFDQDERGFTMMAKLSSDFGPTREQRESKRLYDKLILAPMDAYNEAMRLYLAQKYWEAGFAFGKVISLFPNFHLNDKATWYMGNSWRFLRLNSISRETYKEALEEYTTSDMRAYYLYGLQSLDYREGKYEESLKNHAFIINLYPESDIRPDADYLAGQVHFERKNYNVAEKLFTSIKPGQGPYLYAQYTLSIINIETNREQAAMRNLQNVIRDTTMEAGEQLLQDAANLKLGHLYFEQGDQLRQAVEAYSRVPEGSVYGDEAMLGTAWAWIKVNRPEICLQAIERLISVHPQSPLIPEAYLVKGYSLMLQRRYRDAELALERCLELTRKDFVAEADLLQRRREYERYVQDYLPSQQAVKKNALRKPTNRTLQERPALKTEFDRFAKENNEYFTYKLLAESHKKFFRRKEQVIEDAEYALAKATNLLKGRKQTEVIREQKEKEEEIDEEIEELKKKLQELE